MLKALRNGDKINCDLAEIVELVNQFQAIYEEYFPQTRNKILNKYSNLWNQNNKIDLLFSRATKIK